MTTLTADFGAEEAAMQAYFRAGEAKARSLGNRGPVRFTEDGKLHPEILDAYRETGFYVFENVLGAQELAELEADLYDMMDRLPTKRGSPVDHKGRPALGADLAKPVVMWSKPLGDPLGGTAIANGRHPVKMIEPKPAADLPEEIAFLIMGSLQFSDASLRVYGHPDLLRVAAAINGDDFVPFSEATIIKKPGEGSSFAWHQDGTTHWGSPEWNPLTHGFNFMAQLYGCTAANGLWYIPGSHAMGKLDIKAMVEAAGGNRLPDAVPLICNPGDVAMSNRQLVHGSFANTSEDWRVTLNIGFHPRRSVVGVNARGIDGELQLYDAERVRKRSEVIGYAIDARHQHFPGETPYAYRPQVERGEAYRWNDAARGAIKDYNLLDILI
jgi:ectoine hydroxylase-related dioxygenase (phytanoyl-CoA dioxygenase family)